MSEDQNESLIALLLARRPWYHWLLSDHLLPLFLDPAWPDRKSLCSAQH